MPGRSARKRRGTADPRAGWSGVAPLTTAQLTASDIDLEGLLPGHQSSIEQIVLELRGLGGRYHRYLHQDELGPTRAERLAALRSLLDQLDLFLSRLNGSPEHLSLRLSRRLPSDCGSVEHELDKFQAHCNDEEAMRQVGEAAAGESSRVGASPMANDAEVLDEIWHIAATDQGDLIGFAIACARIKRLRCRVQESLADLERRRGAERSESLRWLVWQLCELYKRETGNPVTISA